MTKPVAEKKQSTFRSYASKLAVAAGLAGVMALNALAPNSAHANEITTDGVRVDGQLQGQQIQKEPTPYPKSDKNTVYAYVQGKTPIKVEPARTPGMQVRKTPTQAQTLGRS